MKKILLAALFSFAVVFHPAAVRAEGAPGDTAVYGPTTAVIGASPVGSSTFVHVSKGGGGVIDVGQIFSEAVQPWVGEIVNCLILAAVGWFGTWLRTRFKVELDQKQRDALSTFLQNQAGALIASGDVKMKGVTVAVNSPMLAAAANQAAMRIPDAMKHFGLIPQVIADKIVEAIPQIEAGARMIAQAHVAASPASEHSPAPEQLP